MLDRVSVRVVTDNEQGLTVSGIWDALGAGNAFSEDDTLCAAGVPIKVEDFGGVMHNKFMIVDANGPSPRVITGSMNWSASADNTAAEGTSMAPTAMEQVPRIPTRFRNWLNYPGQVR